MSYRLKYTKTFEKQIEKIKKNEKQIEKIKKKDKALMEEATNISLTSLRDLFLITSIFNPLLL